jgi:hypothetical protein
MNRAIAPAMSPTVAVMTRTIIFLSGEGNGDAEGGAGCAPPGVSGGGGGSETDQFRSKNGRYINNMRRIPHWLTHCFGCFHDVEPPLVP